MTAVLALVDVPAHPAFASHFSAPLYGDPTDEFGPFGSELGWDVAAEWSDRRAELDDRTTLRRLAEQEFDDPADADEMLSPSPELALELDPALVGLGFTLLRSTGRIDPEGRELLLEALRRLEVGYGGLTDHYGRMIADLETLPFAA
jgi:uncharacterized protein YfeS